MGLLAECPICNFKQSIKNKVCKCGENLDQAKRRMRVKYWINFRFNGKQVRQSVDSFEGLNGFSIEDARKAVAKRCTQKAENRLLEIRSDAKITFAKLSDWYLSQPSVKKLKSYRAIIAYLKRFNISFGDVRVMDVKPNDLDNYQILLLEAGLKPKSIDNLLNYVKTMLIKAEDNELIDPSSLRPFRKNKNLLGGKLRGSNARRRVITQEEYVKLSAACEHHTRDIFAFGYWTGCRAGEIRKLTWQMVDLRNRMITLPADVTKEGRAKKIPIGDDVYKLLTGGGRVLRMAAAVGNVFTCNGKPIERLFSTGLKSAAQRAGIPWGREVENGWIFHDLRRTFKTEARKAGVHKSVIDAIVGHSDPRDMDTYYNVVDDSDLHEAIKKLKEYRSKMISKLSEKHEVVFASVD